MKFDKAALIVAWVFIVGAVKAMQRYPIETVVPEARKLFNEVESELKQLEK